MKRLIIVMAFATVMAGSAFAKDLGTIGTTFPIAEENLLTFIHQRLAMYKKDGKLKAMKKEFIKRVKKQAMNPTPVAGMHTTDVPKTFLYNPSIEVTHNVYGLHGTVIVKAGTVVNPLTKVPLDTTLLFLNADSKRQVAWVEKAMQKYPENMVILVKGNLLKAYHNIHERIYFDQYGKITKQLGIHFVPAIVTQKGLRLQIQEVRP